MVSTTGRETEDSAALLKLLTIPVAYNMTPRTSRATKPRSRITANHIQRKAEVSQNQPSIGRPLYLYPQAQPIVPSVPIAKAAHSIYSLFILFLISVVARTVLRAQHTPAAGAAIDLGGRATSWAALGFGGLCCHSEVSLSSFQTAAAQPAALVSDHTVVISCTNMPFAALS